MIYFYDPLYFLFTPHLFIFISPNALNFFLCYHLLFHAFLYLLLSIHLSIFPSFSSFPSFHLKKIIIAFDNFLSRVQRHFKVKIKNNFFFKFKIIIYCKIQNLQKDKSSKRFIFLNIWYSWNIYILIKKIMEKIKG